MKWTCMPPETDMYRERGECIVSCRIRLNSSPCTRAITSCLPYSHLQYTQYHPPSSPQRCPDRHATVVI